MASPAAAMTTPAAWPPVPAASRTATSSSLCRRDPALCPMSPPTPTSRPPSAIPPRPPATASPPRLARTGTRRSTSVADNTGDIGDTVYNDANNNGQQDASEPGLADVTVRAVSGGHALGEHHHQRPGQLSVRGLARRRLHSEDGPGHPADRLHPDSRPRRVAAAMHQHPIL